MVMHFTGAKITVVLILAFVLKLFIDHQLRHWCFFSITVSSSLELNWGRHRSCRSDCPCQQSHSLTSTLQHNEQQPHYMHKWSVLTWTWCAKSLSMFLTVIPTGHWIYLPLTFQVMNYIAEAINHDLLKNWKHIVCWNWWWPPSSWS
jgi:hypothetical protein